MYGLREPTRCEVAMDTRASGYGPIIRKRALARRLAGLRQGPGELDRYRLKYDNLRAAALSSHDTRTYLQQNG
jgi:hypothetical protein